ncbi:HalOD1 output domain-containing protein [Halorarius litoreus]|uniref:HalOD1 output domain-containing protein n=1 Tax=Halorarius litoreus TaxID=2962676 RepID=UPI0020CED182|nr:HalOD1 output domain-containing protein [Halorarius litoreus]
MSESTMKSGNSTDPIYERTYHSTSESLVSVIIDAIANAAGVEPAALDKPLYEAIDTDALSKLFHNLDGSVDGYVAFNYLSYRVFVHSDGAVAVYERI